VESGRDLIEELFWHLLGVMKTLKKCETAKGMVFPVYAMKIYY